MSGEEKRNRFKWEAESHIMCPVAFHVTPVFFAFAAVTFHLTYKDTGQKEE
jgi:hypothetical protein